MLWRLDALLKEVLIGKINTSIWFRCMKKKSVIEDKWNNEAQRSQPQKAHLTGEFVAVA